MTINWSPDFAGDTIGVAVFPRESVLSRIDLARMAMGRRLLLDGSAVVRQSLSDDSPKWNKLFPLGARFRSDFPGGKIDFTPAFLGAMVENWKRMGGAPLPADYLHRGDSEGDLPASEKVASGWIEDLDLRADGLYGLIRWTDRARVHIAADEFRYLSPTFATDSMDRATGKPQGPCLYGCALLNDPFLTDLPRVAATAAPNPNPPEHKNMNKHLLAALALIGLTESSTEADVTAAQAKLEAERLKLAAEKDEAIKMASTNGAGVEALKVALTAEKTERVALAAKVAEMESAAQAMAIEVEADKLFAAGKLPGKDTEHFTAIALAMGLPKAVEIFGSRSPVALTELGHGNGEKEVTPAAAFEQLKLKAEDLVKAGAPRAESFIRACSAHPDLAKAAESLTSPNRTAPTRS